MGNFNDAVEKAGRMGGISGKVETVFPEKRGFSLLKLLLGQDAESHLEFLTRPYPQPAFLPPWFH